MRLSQPIELTMIRHAPVQSGGMLYGRKDMQADLSDNKSIAFVKKRIKSPSHIISSSAIRCVATAHAIWPELTNDKIFTDSKLWEQDFGDWEGFSYSNLPDIGSLSTEDLANHRAPNGESFLDLCERVIPVIKKHGEKTDQSNLIMTIHAGVIRAAIGMALGDYKLGLRFDIKPLSITRILMLPDSQFSILSVNECA